MPIFSYLKECVENPLINVKLAFNIEELPGLSEEK